MTAVAGAVGAIGAAMGAGGISQGIARVISTVVKAIASFFRWLANAVLRIARWYFNFLRESPEWAITIPILLIYFFS